MAGLEALIFFLVIPACASAAAAFAGWLVYAGIRERGAGSTPSANPFARFLVYPTIVGTPTIFGFVLWMLSRPVAAEIDAGSGTAVELTARLLVWSAIAYAWVSCTMLAAQAWVARVRMGQFIGADFGRVEPIIVLPEVATIFALVLAFLAIGQIDGILQVAAPVTQAGVDAAVLAFQLFALSSLAVVASVGLSNRVQALAGRGFLQALIRAESGIAIVLGAFAWVFLTLQSIGS